MDMHSVPSLPLSLCSPAMDARTACSSAAPGGGLRQRERPLRPGRSGQRHRAAGCLVGLSLLPSALGLDAGLHLLQTNVTAPAQGVEVDGKEEEEHALTPPVALGLFVALLLVCGAIMWFAYRRTKVPLPCRPLPVFPRRRRVPVVMLTGACSAAALSPGECGRRGRVGVVDALVGPLLERGQARGQGRKADLWHGGGSRTWTSF